MSSSTVSIPVPSTNRHAFKRRVEEIKPSKTDINFVIMDYLINEGYPRAAKKFAMEANIQAPEEGSIQVRVEIRNAIHAGDIETAIAKINELNPQILDSDPALHFSLLRLQLIELIRKCTESPNGDITPALTFASSQLAPRAPTNPTFLQQLETTMALLIFPPENLSPNLAQLLEPDLRQEVANAVNEAILASTGARREAQLRNLVRLRSWAESKARSAGKDIPAKLPLGLDPENEHDDDAMNGAGDADAMVS